MDTIIRLFFISVAAIIFLVYEIADHPPQPNSAPTRTQTVDVEKVFGVNLKGSK